MQAVILAGGLATRLRPLTEKIPKSMVKIAGKPFLQYQLEMLKKVGINEVVLCVGYLGDQVEKYFADGEKFGLAIKYSYETEYLRGTGGALKNAEGILTDEFITLYGDSYLYFDLIKVLAFFKRWDRLALMLVYKNYDRYDKSNIIIDGNIIRKYGRTNAAEKMIYIDYGASIFHKKVLELIPVNAIYSMGELYNRLIDMEQLIAYEVGQRFYEIGSPGGLDEFRKYVKANIGLK